MKQSTAQWISASLVIGSLILPLPGHASSFDLNAPSSAGALNWTTFKDMFQQPMDHHRLAVMRLGLNHTIDSTLGHGAAAIQFDEMIDVIPTLDPLLGWVPLMTGDGISQAQSRPEIGPSGNRTLFQTDGLRSFWLSTDGHTSQAGRNTTGLDVETAMERVDQSRWQLQLRKQIGRPLGLMAEFAQYMISVREPLAELAEYLVSGSEPLLEFRQLVGAPVVEESEEAAR